MAELIHSILSQDFPNTEQASYEIAALKSQLEIPKGVIHVISDIHGEARKLKHVINNASGRLRPLVDSLFSHRLTPSQKQELLNVLYYPTELLSSKSKALSEKERLAWVMETLQNQFSIIREIVKNKRRNTIWNYTPVVYRELFDLLLNYPAGGHNPVFLEVQLQELVAREMDFLAIQAASRLIRNLAVEELIVAGDLGDRGSRIDWVIDYLKRQSSVSVVWGNHDVSWMGACLGNQALIAIVLRISLRYRRLFQLEEGYGILTKALEILVEHVYQDDPAADFYPKRGGERDSLLIARMQKAISVIQFKLEGQLMERHPEWNMDDRNVMSRIDYAAGTIEISGKTYQLKDSYFPTVSPDDPNKLSAEEQQCIDRLTESFTSSAKLWQHMSWVAQSGSMCLVRDKAVIFHACLALDENEQYEALEIDGQTHVGPELFPAFDSVVKRAFRAGTNATDDDKDWFYYLWAGPKSPLFGKDKMASFESYFIAEKETHQEQRNPYFEKLHDREFCDQLCREIGVAEDGLIVNGHVPVKVEKGENPVKRGGNAVTIDGAFSEAYGDRGYTLILSPEGDELAEHHGFRDPVSIVRSGEDIIPKMQNIRRHFPPRLTKDTEQGAVIREKINALEGLVQAYASGALTERSRP
ncbi:fructose-bisphosphatase class III [Persicirhabdus sediminis]|uniref:Fructose-bisphosphatase class III n=1 Tax=Persicirhabdus sediminis TaxID=454144 RepID=A0A8J7MFG0_9BACT|nr:fructose-bisphosphatase class III [Persicirhabdus sediminis]MBK1791752.1 fructose-bisphosphatase class III [Persicirhabdus sediminis]